MVGVVNLADLACVLRLRRRQKKGHQVFEEKKCTLHRKSWLRLWI